MLALPTWLLELAATQTTRLRGSLGYLDPEETAIPTGRELVLSNQPELSSKTVPSNQTASSTQTTVVDISRLNLKK